MGLKLKARLAGGQPVRVAGSSQTSQITIFRKTSWWEPGEGVGVG